jgi:hypothetical protein
MPSPQDYTDRRQAYAAWLEANGINPSHVLQDADITIIEGPDGRMLRCEVCDLTPDGHRQVDERGERVATKTVTVPLAVEPPGWWEPYEKPTRDQLLAAIGKSLPALRQAIAELPAVCRYHGDQLEPHRPSYGSESCCDTGRPAMRRRRAEEALLALAAQLDQP